MNSAGETATVLVMMVVMAVLGAAVVTAVEIDADRDAERRCAQRHGVYACEKVVTWRPINDGDAE